MTGQQRVFNFNSSIENPLRIFFLCGSHFDLQNLEKDKRKNLQTFLEQKNPNYKCVILEDNFLFKDKVNLLNYNDIGLKHLKIIENLTSAFSDKIIIFHESISTAAEIGLFSGDKDHNEKMLILVPDPLTVEENYISGFISLAYDSSYSDEQNIDIINYFPSTELSQISDNNRKLHTHFHNATIPTGLKRDLEKRLAKFQPIAFNIKNKKYNTSNGYYELSKTDIIISLPLNMLIGYLLALFNEPTFRNLLRKKAIIGSFDISSKIKNERDKKRVLEIKSVIYKVVSDFKKSIYKYFTDTINDLENSRYSYSQCKIIITNIDVDFSKVLNYFVYLLYAMKLVSVNNEKLIISAGFSEIYSEYEVLLRKKEFNLKGNLTL